MNLNGRDKRENVYTEVTRDAATILQEAIDEIAADMGVPYGEQRVSTKMIRQRIREVKEGYDSAMSGEFDEAKLDQGDRAFQEIGQLLMQNGHTAEGDNCPVCQQVAAVLGESK